MNMIILLFRSARGGVCGNSLVLSSTHICTHVCHSMCSFATPYCNKGHAPISMTECMAHGSVCARRIHTMQFSRSAAIKMQTAWGNAFTRTSVNVSWEVWSFHGRGWGCGVWGWVEGREGVFYCALVTVQPVIQVSNFWHSSLRAIPLSVYVTW